MRSCFFLDEQSVRNFLERYRLGKIDALLDNHCRGRESKLTGEEKDRLRQHVAENLYMGCALVIAYIQFEFGKAYSKSGAHRELPANSGRRRLNLGGAVDAESHEAIVINSPTIDADYTLEFLVRIEAANPGAESIYVVCDNTAYYHSRKVKEYLSSSRISLVFLPPYSLNLNVIERLWKFSEAR